MEQQFTFTRPLAYEEKSNGDLVISLDISTTEPDLIHDVVTLNFLKSMQRQIMDRNLKLDIEHEAFRGANTEEKEINKTKVPAGRMLEPSIQEYKNEKNETHHRLNIKGLVNKFRNDYEKIKGNILNKFLDAGSIAFIPTKKREETKDGVDYRYLEDGILLNTALTGNPMNTTAQLRNIISKSIDSIEKYQEEKEKNPEIMNHLNVKAKSYSSSQEDIIKLQEVKNMSEEEEKKAIEAKAIAEKEAEEAEAEKVEAEKVEAEEKAKAEMKALAEKKDELESEKEKLEEENESLKSENAEMKAKLEKAVHKSKASQVDKAGNFVGEKALNPLDVIA